MKEAGYDGKPVRFLVTTQYDYMFKIGQVAQAQLEEVGFKVDVQVMDWATLLQKRTNPALWEGFIASHSLVADPTLITIMNPSYPGWWDSPDKRAALDVFVTETDPAKRMAAWRQIQAIFYRDVPTIKLGEFLQLYGISSKLRATCHWRGRASGMLGLRRDGASVTAEAGVHDFAGARTLSRGWRACAGQTGGERCDRASTVAGDIAYVDSLVFQNAGQMPG